MIPLLATVPRGAVAETFYSKVLSYSPEAYWPLEDVSPATAFADVTGNGKDAPIIGATLEAAAVMPTAARAASFDGDDYGTKGTSNPVSTGPSVTIGGWIKTTETGEAPICSRDDAGSNRSWQLKLKNGGKAEWIVFYSGGVQLVTSLSTYNDGDPHFIVGVYDHLTPDAILYVDGSNVANSTSISGGLTSRGSPVYIGGDDTSLNERLIGSLNHIFIINSVLTPAQILELYNLGAGT